MRYVLFNYVHPDDVAAWEAWTPEEQAADVERHRAWFGKWRAHIAGGEELDLPRTVKTLRPGRQGEGISVTDGPYVETKELLGGFVILDAADMEEAIAIASVAVPRDPAQGDRPAATDLSPRLNPAQPPPARAGTRAASTATWNSQSPSSSSRSG